jgi:RNA polymerase sigma-70 factor (ECF subfamily)
VETAQNKMTKETLGQLIIDSEETMYHIAKSLLYNDADCADAIQEAIVKAFVKLHTLKDDSYAKTWLIRIVMNECYAIMRKEKKIISLQDYQMNEQETESKDYSDLYEAIFRLPEQIKLCVTLYYMEGYSVKEVAALLDTTESAVKNRLAKARGKLKEALAD